MELEQAVEAILAKLGVQPTKPGLEGIASALDAASVAATIPLRASACEVLAWDLRKVAKARKQATTTAMALLTLLN